MPKRRHEAAVTQPHDRLVKFAFARREHAVGLLKAVLDRRIVEALSWDTLRLENRSFVSPALRGRHVDLLFSARIAGEPLYFYVLLEQQRKVEKLMILRVGAYMWEAWKDLVKDEPTRDAIPPIVPILLHHSATGWTAATSFADIVAVPEALRGVIAAYTPSFDMLVVDVSPGQASRIVEGMLTGFGKVVLWCLSVAGDDERLKNEIHRMAEAFDAMLAGLDHVDAFHAVVRYLLATHRTLNAPEIARLLLEMPASRAGKRAIMDELDVFKVEGRKEGLLDQLRARFGRVPADAEARVLAAKEATLAQWSIRVLTAPTLEAVLDGKAKKAAPARRPAARKRARAA
jgi:hypothetical protein